MSDFIRKPLMLILVLSFSGCRGSFQPLPPYYMAWSKPGSNVVEIKKKLLECGAPHPEGSSINAGYNDSALTHYCMVNAGYTSLNSFEGGRPDNERWCRNKPELPACQSGAVIPEPSVERRLNSQYCKLRVSRDYCMEVNKDTDGFICGDRNFDKPPPECLP